MKLFISLGSTKKQKIFLFWVFAHAYIVAKVTAVVLCMTVVYHCQHSSYGA